MVTILGCSYDGPGIVEQGDRINFAVDVDVGNGDRTPAEFTIGLFVDGEEVGRSPGSLDATTKDTITVRGGWDAPASPGDFSVSTRILDENTLQGEPELSTIRVNPSTVEEGETLNIETEVAHNRASTDVTVVYAVAGREIGTETAAVGPQQGAGSDTRFVAQFDYDRLVNRGVAPTEGTLDTTVTARLSGESFGGGPEAAVTFVGGDSGGGGGGSGDDPAPGPGPGPGEPSTSIESVTLSPATVTPDNDFTVNVTVRHTGEAEDVGVIIRGAGRSFATASRRVTQGTNVLAQRVGYDRLRRRGLAPRSGSISIPITVELDGETTEADRELTVDAGSTSSAPQVEDAAVSFR